MSTPPRQEDSNQPEHAGWRRTMHDVIFNTDTPGAKAFDVALLICIVGSIIAVMLETVKEIRDDYGPILMTIEWVITILFTIEYAARLISVKRPAAYAKSFYGIVDLLSILPTYLSLLFAGSQALIVIRALRLLRAFRVLKLAQFVGEAGELRRALRASRHKIVVFIFTVFTLVIVIGAVMYLIESRDPESGFTSLPQSMYWTIVTMTTVGYGDITPQSVVGKTLAAAVMILGYGIIAVPTGIVTAEMTRGVRRKDGYDIRSCRHCGREGHDPDATFCKYCGGAL